MNRAIGAFVLFCLLLLVVLALLVWWVGPNLMRLAFDGDRAGAPYYAVVLRAAEASGYRERFDALIRDADAANPTSRLLARHANLAVIRGGRADEWAALEAPTP